MPLDLLSPLGAEQQLRQNYVHQLRQTINAYLPAYIFVGEALQNALDAVRVGGAGNHRIEVRMDFDERTVSVRDSGLGFPDRPNLLFLGGGEKQGRGLAGMVGVGLKVVLFSSDRFTLRATNAAKSLRVDVNDAYRYGDTSPPSLALPSENELPLDDKPAFETGTGTLLSYRFPINRDGSPSIPELFLRDVKEACFSNTNPDFDESLSNAVAQGAYPNRLAALVASHLRRYSYLGSTIMRPEYSRLTVEITIKASTAALGEFGDLIDNQPEVTFDVEPTYHTVINSLAWAGTPKPVVQAQPLGDGGTNLSRAKLGFNRTEYSEPEEWELLLTDARGRVSEQAEMFREKLFPKLRSIILTIGRISQFNKFCPGGSQRVISARGVATQHRIDIYSGRNQQYVRCFDVVVEVDGDLNYGKTQLTDMHLVSNINKFINEAYRRTIQNACRNYVGTQSIEDRTSTPFWSRERLDDGSGPLTISTVPYDENDVIALFFELSGRKILDGFLWFGLSSHDTYDGRAVIRREFDTPDPLDNPKETDLRTVEFKLRGASIARDFDRDEKHIENVDLVICYDLDESAVDAYQIVNWKDSTLCQYGEEPYPFVKTVLLDTVTGREVQMLALRDVLVPDIVQELPALPPDARDAD